MNGAVATTSVSLLLFLALIAIGVLWLLYAQLQAQHRHMRAQEAETRAQYERVQDQYEKMQSQYMVVQTRMNELAQEQFTAWRDTELEALRARLWETAWNDTLAKARAWLTENQQRIREEAIRQSTSVVTGKVTEHLTPYIGRFPYNPKDVRFLGAPVDLIVFDGMSENNLQQIVFLEIKTGAGSLTTRERRIRDIVAGKRVVWEEFHVPAG